jgi:hypothetical protein
MPDALPGQCLEGLILSRVTRARTRARGEGGRGGDDDHTGSASRFCRLGWPPSTRSWLGSQPSSPPLRTFFRRRDSRRPADLARPTCAGKRVPATLSGWRGTGPPEPNSPRGCWGEAPALPDRNGTWRRRSLCSGSTAGRTSSTRGRPLSRPSPAAAGGKTGRACPLDPRGAAATLLEEKGQVSDSTKPGVYRPNGEFD